MANNNTDGEIILGLDISQTKSTIEKDLEQILKQINNLEVSIAHANLDNQAISELQKKLTQISNLTVNVSNINVNPNQVRQAQQTGQQTGELVGKAFQKGLENVTSRGTGKRNFYKIDPNDAKNFENAMKKQVNQWTKGKGNLIDVKISTRSSFDSEIGRNIERLHQATVTYNNELGETIKKTVAWRQIGERTINGITEPIMGFAEVQGQYSKSLDNTAKATNNFVNKQKKATASLQNDLAKIKADYESQNKTRPIKNENSQQLLASKYTEVEQAVNAMSTASEEAFVDAEIYAKKLINELEIMVTQFRDAETASNKMKGINVEEGVGVATANFDKIKAQVQEVGLDLTELSKRFETLISDKSKANLDAFNDQLRVSQAELDAAKTKAKIDAKTDGNKNEVYDLLDKRTQAYQEILTINEKINRLNPETDSAQIKDLERQRNEWSKINQEAAETMTYYAQQVLSEEELVQLAKDRADALKQVQNNVATSFAASDEKQANKESNSTAKRLQTLQNKLDTEQPKYTTKYIDEQVASLQKYGLAADEAERQVKELRQALADMSNTNLSAEERLAAEKKYQTELNRTSGVVKETRLEWQGLATEQQRLSLANRIEAFMQKNTKITKSAKEELQRYVTSLRNLDQEMSKVEKNNINAFFQETQNRMRALGKLGYALSDQLKQAANSFTQWISVSSLIMTGIYKTRQAVSELVEVDNILTEISKTSDMTKQELADLGKTSFNTASQMGRTATDYLNTVTEMSRSGFYGEQGEAMARQTLLAQTAGDLTNELASKYVLATNAAYKLNGEASKLNKILDGQNMITNRNSVSMTDMAEAMSEAGSVAATYRVDADQFSAMVGTIEAVTKLGGNEIGTGIKSLLINLQNVNSSKITGTLSRAGADMTEFVNGIEKLREPMDILRDLSETFRTLDEDNPLRAEILTNIGGKYQATKLAALLDNFDMYDKMLQDYSEGFGSAAIEADKSANNISGSLNKLHNNWVSIINNMVNSDAMLLGVNRLNDFLSLINETTDALGSFGTLGMIGTGIASAKGYGLNVIVCKPLFIRSYNNAI